ncbi:Phosphoribosylglycinamide formyltransferase [Croceitalea dokdonensis DOKDO 023]|uniref:Phosphoribosylglycinamide formyltransferase n=1 Tax=Croceitalea dokdonensis DOKDO 023 TaxID=1300341 RepID=A0A0P7AXY1_9FLAO|nr:phosphoribosylglycinamide formyltransferase [Croceitalea dokdonensis]KPM33062.1 Phosphoribosylglycinamide formyltransferase [Croceitalea dokdonensis DOKDO 023]
MKKIIILASGSGSNAENIITHFKHNPNITIAAVLTNKKTAGVLERCQRLKVPTLVFDREAFYHSTLVLDVIASQEPALIVLAGFLWKIPQSFIDRFPNQIINIHPALLPKYGGKGMYGHHVHKAVKDHAETETGITIHYVNEHYDEGAIIKQENVAVLPSDSVDDIAKKVHQLEQAHFPKVIHNLLVSHG